MAPLDSGQKIESDGAEPDVIEATNSDTWVIVSCCVCGGAHDTVAHCIETVAYCSTRE